MQCGSCGGELTSSYCRSCGAPAPSPLVDRLPLAKRPMGIHFLVTLCVYLIMVVASLALLVSSGTEIVPGILAASPGGCVDPTAGRIPCAGYIWMISPIPLPSGGGGWGIAFGLVILTGPGLLAWFYTILITIFAAHVYLLWRDGPGMVREVGRTLRTGEPPRRLQSAWSGLAMVLAAILAFDTLYLAILLPAVGIQPEAPFPEENEAWYLPFIAAQASFYEELMSRGLHLGLLVGILELDAGVRRRRPWDYLLGGGYDLDGRSFGPLVYTSLTFALAHVLGGPGSWAAWKVVDTLVAGLALGYLFLRYGLAASILLHFGINYFPWELEFGSPTVGAIATLVLVVAGGVAILNFIPAMVQALPGALRWRPTRIAGPVWFTTAPRPSQANPDGPSQGPSPCPSCGATGARASRGRLVCPGCSSPL